MDAIYAFLTLKISSIEFRKCLLEDEELLERISAKLPKSTFAHDPEWKDSPMCAEAFAYDDFDLRKTFTTGYYGLGKLWGACHGYKLIHALFHDEYPGIERSDYYSRLYDLAMDCVPSYVESREASEVIFSVILGTEGLPKAERRKQIKAQIAELFFLNESKKRPRWIQESDWPLYDGRPMRFVGQKAQGEVTRYTFEDDQTKIRRIIEQCY